MPGGEGISEDFRTALDHLKLSAVVRPSANGVVVLWEINFPAAVSKPELFLAAVYPKHHLPHSSQLYK